MTNKEKFEQIYGFEPDCGWCNPLDCIPESCKWFKECQNETGRICDNWWDMDYEPIQEAADYEEKGLMIIMGDDGIFREYKDEFDITIHCESQEEQDQVIEILNQKYISKEDFGRWIPVSERLPEPYMFVNATCRSLVDDREDWVVETIYLPIPKEHNPRHYSDWGNIPMLNWGEAEVIAWVERIIPQPYKAESEAEDGNGKDK